MNKRAARKATMTVLPVFGMISWVCLLGVLSGPVAAYFDISETVAFGRMLLFGVIPPLLVAIWVNTYLGCIEQDKIKSRYLEMDERMGR